jgi:hypothetical protein
LARSERIAALNTALTQLKGFLSQAYCGDFPSEWDRFIRETIVPLRAGYRAYWKAKGENDRSAGNRSAEAFGICKTQLVPAADRALQEMCDGYPVDGNIKKLHRVQVAVENAIEGLHNSMESPHGVY